MTDQLLHETIDGIILEDGSDLLLESGSSSFSNTIEFNSFITIGIPFDSEISQTKDFNSKVTNALNFNSYIRE